MDIPIPTRILLDTNVVNFTLEWGEAIFDGGGIPREVPEGDVTDILALQGIFMAGQRAGWQLAISPKTYEEIIRTTDTDKRARLEKWFNELWLYWREFFKGENLSDLEAESLARRLESSQFLAPFPDIPDRELIAHAIAYKCDAFCTRDRRSIIRHRDAVGSLLSLRFMTPTEWWKELRPHAALWI
jgi:hypothetical protein